MLFEAAVLGSLLYAAEVRSFTAPQLKNFQTWVDGCCLYLADQRRRAMKEDQVTLADIRHRLRIKPLAVYIGLRRLRVLARLAALPPSRLERQALFWWMPSSFDGRLKKGARGTRVRKHLHGLLEEIRIIKGLDSKTWQHSWIEIAAKKKNGRTL